MKLSFIPMTIGLFIGAAMFDSFDFAVGATFILLCLKLTKQIDWL